MYTHVTICRKNVLFCTSEPLNVPFSTVHLFRVYSNCRCYPYDKYTSKYTAFLIYELIFLTTSGKVFLGPAISTYGIGVKPQTASAHAVQIVSGIWNEGKTTGWPFPRGLCRSAGVLWLKNIAQKDWFNLFCVINDGKWMVNECKWWLIIWLVVFRHPSEKWWTESSVGMMFHSQLNGKSPKFHGSKPPTSV